jgi:septum formation protein
VEERHLLPVTYETFTSPVRLVLASGSPRRRELLARLGLPFAVAVSGVNEDVPPDAAPEAMVLDLAVQKARQIAADRPGGLVVGADTTVVLDGAVLGKPTDPDDAVRMLRQLRDRLHRVYTGLAIVDAATGRVERGLVASDVTMRDYADAEIVTYVASGEPLDKAGAYGIQGRGGDLVAAVNGCFYNVVGLPLCELVALLGRFGVTPAAPGPVCLSANSRPCPRPSCPGRRL